MQQIQREGSNWSKTRPLKLDKKSVISISSQVRLDDGAFTSKRYKVLNKIFGFYSKQQRLIGKNPTFEQIENNLMAVSLGEYMKFCGDF